MVFYAKVKAHYRTRRGRRHRVKSYTRREKGKRYATTRGEKFRSLERRIYADYIKKGYTKARAKYIARATAGKVFWRKFGKRRGAEILRRER